MLVNKQKDGAFMAMNAVEKEHYEKCLEDGKEFQDYVVSMLIKHKGIAISSFSSLLFQYGIGEGYQGFEIKLDLPSANTGNLLIETGERTMGEILRRCSKYTI